jgi:hypothetical protein
VPPRTLATAVALTAAMIVTATGAPTYAAPASTVQAQINQQLARYPGGKQINATEVAYGDGAFVITFARPQVGVDGIADCPQSWFCFYEHTNFGYPRGKLSSCGWQDLTWWGWQDRTESVHYNMSSGSVTFIEHSGPPDHSGDYGLFNVGTGNRTMSDVYPYRNMANHVYRFC